MIYLQKKLGAIFICSVICSLSIVIGEYLVCLFSLFVSIV